jgi:hypothetical protein
VAEQPSKVREQTTSARRVSRPLPPWSTASPAIGLRQIQGSQPFHR